MSTRCVDLPDEIKKVFDQLTVAIHPQTMIECFLRQGVLDIFLSLAHDLGLWPDSTEVSINNIGLLVSI